MKKKALRKDFYMEIKKSLNRFLSILLIVALGVAFYSGIQSAAPDMRYSGDAYFDEHKLMDIKVIGTLGLTQRDVTALSQVDGISKAEPGYMTDVLCGEETQSVLRLESISPTLNRLTPVEGRLPETTGECFVDIEFLDVSGYEIGDEIVFFREDEDDFMLKRERFTIVGAGSSPLYISFGRGNTTLGNGELAGVGYILPEDFDSEVYTQVYMEVRGARDVTVYTDAYDLLIENVMERVEAIAPAQCEIRYQEVTDEAQEALADAEKELEDGKAEGESELADAREELAEGESELADGKQELADAKQEIADGEQELADGEQEIADNKATIAEKEQELADGKTQIADGWTQLASGKSELAAQEARIKSERKKLNDGEKQISQAKKDLEAGRSAYEAGLKQYEDGKAAYEAGETQYAQGLKQLQAQEAAWPAQKEQLETQRASLAQNQTQLESAIGQINANLSTAQAGQSAAQQGFDEVESLYLAAQQGLTDAQAALTEAEQAQNNAQSALTDAEQRYQSAQAALPGAQQARDNAKAAADSATQIRDDAQSAWNSAVQIRDEKNAAVAAAQTKADGLSGQVTGLQREIADLTAKIDAEPDEAKKEELRQQKAAKESELADAQQGLSAAQGELSAAQGELAGAQTAADNAQRNFEAAQGEFSAAQSALNTAQGNLDAAQAELSAAETAYNTAQSGLTEAQRALTEARGARDTAQAGLDAVQEPYDTASAALAKANEAVAYLQGQLAEQGKNLEQVKGGIAQIDAGILQAETAMTDGRKKLEDSRVQLDAAKKELDDNLPQLNEAKAAVEAGQKEIAKNEKKIADGRKQLNEGAAQIASAKKTLADSEQQLLNSQAQIADGERQLADGKQQLADAEKEIADARTELEDGKKELADAEKEIADAEKELADGWKEYEDGVKEFEEEIADAEQKIADARQEIADLKEPEWMVTDRSDLPDNIGYGENADRMRNIGEVFPVLFFLVAALISLTTMTRMVEEERTQIGTLKALGYSKAAIASKYLGYALIATLTGSMIGVLGGEKFLPFVIVTAYKIMYHHMPNIELPYNMKFALIATGAALIATMGSTLAACYKELAATPAVLMRPPAPKEGKRVLLERVTFLWKHLSFTWKSTVRNLFRYKKRFFMTIFGIGGCMALMIVGYGLRDSIVDIADLQFRELQTYHGMVILDTEAKEADLHELESAAAADGRLENYTKALMELESVQIGKKHWDLYVMVPEDIGAVGDFLHFRDRESKETYELTDEGAIITEKIAKEYGLNPGDTIILEDEESGTIEIPVTAVAENYLSHYLYLTPSLYEKCFGEKPEYNQILYRVNEGAEEQVTAIGEQLLAYDAAMSISYTETMKGQIDDMLVALDSVMIVLIVSAGLLAFVVLYNLNNININERKRELATIKVLGFYDGEVSAYVYRENILITILGIFAGVILGIVLHRFVITTVEVDACMFGRNINLPSFLISSAFTAGFSAFVNVVMHFKLKKIDMVESLKSVE